MHLGRSGGAFPSQTNIIHCVFSGSDVGSKWRLLCSLLHTTTEHLNHLGAILVYSCSSVKTMANWWQLTQGGSKVKCSVNQQLGRGLGLCDITQAGIWEWLDIWKGKLFNEINKNHYRMVVYTHCQPTFQFKQLVKVHVASDDPFN